VAYISSVVQEAETRTKNADVLVAGKKRHACRHNESTVFRTWPQIRDALGEAEEFMATKI
jgi:hypothetical protein